MVVNSRKISRNSASLVIAFVHTYACIHTNVLYISRDSLTSFLGITRGTPDVIPKWTLLDCCIKPICRHCALPSTRPTKAKQNYFNFMFFTDNFKFDLFLWAVFYFLVTQSTMPNINVSDLLCIDNCVIIRARWLFPQVIQSSTSNWQIVFWSVSCN